jgi:hypothetical protein
MSEHLLPTAKIDDNLLFPSMTRPYEVPYGNIDDVHSEVIAPIDEGSSPLEFLHKVAEEMRLVRIVQLLDTPLRDYAAIVCLLNMSASAMKVLTGQQLPPGIFAYSHP